MTVAIPPLIGIPRYVLSIAKTEVSAELKADISEVEFCEDLDMPAMLSFSVNLWDGMRQRLKEAYLDQFAIGTPLELSLGINGEAPVFTGEVTALEPEFGGLNGSDSLKVRAYNRLYRLNFGSRQRTFQNKTSSEIVSEIANNAGLTAEVDSTTEKHAHMTQENITDLAFLLQLAGPLNYEVMVDDQKLHFRKPRLDEGAHVLLTYRRDLTEFTPRQRVVPEGTTIEVRGWDMKTKKPILGQAGSGDEASKMGGQRTGADISAEAFGSATRTLPGQVVLDADEATNIAKAWYNRRQGNFIEAEGESAGSHLIRAGKTIEIAGVGQAFSLSYYVVSAKHTIGPTGYRTRFEARRSAL